MCVMIRVMVMLMNKKVNDYDTIDIDMNITISISIKLLQEKAVIGILLYGGVLLESITLVNVQKKY